MNKNKYSFYKKPVENKKIYITNTIGDRLIKPTEIQNKLDEIMNKYNCTCFIHPSETENEIKIYIESNHNICKIKKEINTFMINAKYFL